MNQIINREIIVVSGSLADAGKLNFKLNLDFQPTEVIVKTISYMALQTDEVDIQADLIYCVRTNLLQDRVIAHFPLQLVYNIVGTNYSYNTTYHGEPNTTFLIRSNNVQGDYSFYIRDYNGGATLNAWTSSALAVTLEFIERKK